jgi:hypothetical protein
MYISILRFKYIVGRCSHEISFTLARWVTAWLLAYTHLEMDCMNVIIVLVRVRTHLLTQ